MKPPFTTSPNFPSTNIGGYRYFFNGQEVDNEVFGEVANFGYEFRQYDSRLARWWSVDPKWSEYPALSPFVFCNGSPIMLMDPDGEWPIDRAKRFMKKHENAKLLYEKDGSYSVQYTDPRDKGVVIHLRKFKMNLIERLISKIQTPAEKIEKSKTYRGGIFGVTSDPNSYPPGQDEITDADVKTVNLDALQQLYVPESHSMDDIIHNILLSTNKKNNESIQKNEVEGTSGKIMFLYDKPQKNGLSAFSVNYSGTKDSIEKRTEQEEKGYRVGKIEIKQ